MRQTRWQPSVRNCIRTLRSILGRAHTAAYGFTRAQYQPLPQGDRGLSEGTRRTGIALARRLLCRRLSLARRPWRPAQRPQRVNVNWGHYTEDNSFGTHEFIGFCKLIGAEPYFAANVGSGSPREFRDWIEYGNFPKGSTLSDEGAANGSPEPFNVRYWGVGNEQWGCAGNFQPDAAAAAFRQFATFGNLMGSGGDMRRITGQPDLYLVGCPQWKRRTLARAVSWIGWRRAGPCPTDFPCTITKPARSIRCTSRRKRRLRSSISSRAWKRPSSSNVPFSMATIRSAAWVYFSTGGACGTASRRATNRNTARYGCNPACAARWRPDSV